MNSSKSWKTLVLSAVILVCGAAAAQAPQNAPKGANGICKDGTYSMSASKSGACRGHNGVQTWYMAAAAPAASGNSTAATAKTAATPAPAPAAKMPPAAMPAPAPSTPVASAPATTATAGKKLGPSQAAAQKTAATGGAPGLVWVNTSSNVYHCYGTTFYGKTKAGAYMSEADAKAKGARGDHGQSCAAK